MQAIVQSDGAVGPARVSASAPGLAGDAISILALGGRDA
jgi:hypothetical protein